MPEQILRNGVVVGEIREAPEAPDTTGREVALPSGAKATVRQGKGKDLIRVQSEMKANANDPDAENMFMMAVIAQLTRIDGKRITKEELLEMPLGDVLALQREVVGDNFLSLIPATSQP